MAIDNEKRVACLYRVSTKGQMDKDDIPMQKRACKDFIEKNKNWVLAKEYTEKGISGFRVEASKRDELQRAKADAEAGLFDILLVFMFDRLGRRDDETPFVVEWFTKQGVEVWSTQEGRQSFDNHTDKLINYLRYWQGSGESLKTSLRVKEKHEQMVKDGIYRGGTPAYGYCLVKSGVFNKKDKELLKLQIDPIESKIVEKMFDLVYSEGYGGNRIVKYLNENAIPSRKGGSWTLGVVNIMLRNPIYKGYISYDKNKRAGKDDNFKRQNVKNWILSDKPNEELIIIEEDIWNKVQEIRKSRTPFKNNNQDIKKEGDQYTSTKSPLLFVGKIRCGTCSSPLTTTYDYKTWELLDGTKKVTMKPKYRCSGKATGKTNCTGQTTYVYDKLEGKIMKQVYKYLDELKNVDMTTEINKYKQKNSDTDIIELKRLNAKLVECNKDLNTYDKEVAKSINGQSNFKPELLSRLIDETEKEIINLNESISLLESKVNSVKYEIKNMLELQKLIPTWKEEFEIANNDKKKRMLSLLVEQVTVFKDTVRIKTKLYVEDFIASLQDNRVYNKCKGESNYTCYTTNRTVLEQTLYAVL